MNEEIKAIPYSKVNFLDLRKKNYYYVDKTRFISKVEQSGDFLMLIRPRKMGKSLWLAILEAYYDMVWEERFEEMFHDTDIAKHPTPLKNSFMTLHFDFSLVNPNLEKLEQSFESHTSEILWNFFQKYQSHFESTFLARMEEKNTSADQLNSLFVYAVNKGLKIYLFIDEYDNFANTILSTNGKKSYHDLTHGTGFFKHFFALFKGGSQHLGLGQIRLFITGVSPVTLDDVTSGANNIKNISLRESFNEVLGFTEAELRQMLEYYDSVGCLTEPVEDYLAIMKQWYNNYRFAKKAQTQLYNTDMVLYFVDYLLESKSIPEDLIDHNVRIDYQKLRGLILLERMETSRNSSASLNGNFDRLKKVMEEGEVKGEVVSSFPFERLGNRANFYSLLYYFGLLTYAPSQGSRSILRIPNRTVQHLVYGYIREAFYDVDCFRVDPWELAELVADMAYEGKWEGFFTFLAKEIDAQTAIRDYLKEEKVIQGFLLAYLNVANYFLSYSETESNKGYIDIFLDPFLAKYPDLTTAYLIELKYLPRSEEAPSVGEKEPSGKFKKLLKEAREQLQQYEQSPRIENLQSSVQLKKLILIFHGWELIHMESI